jgi:hypothetical protein
VGTSESKAKGSFGQKEFCFSNMGETAHTGHSQGLFDKIQFSMTLKGLYFTK